MAESWNVGRTGRDFQCLQPTINGLFCNGLQWRQVAVELQAPKQKGRREAGLSVFGFRS
jgi:hypothetical protein